MREINGNVILVGDLHGKRSEFLHQVKIHDVRDSTFIILGDCGLGFGGSTVQKDYSYLNKQLSLRKNKLFFIRGNHDNPIHWKDKTFRENNETLYPNIKHLLDGELVSINSKTYLIIGGSISIDRSYRKVNSSYWLDEGMSFPQVEQPIDNFTGILAHVGPIPVSSHKNNLTFWYNRDADLPKDIMIERQLIDKIVNIFQPPVWYFGHFHLTESFDYCTEDSKHITRCHCLNELHFQELI